MTTKIKKIDALVTVIKITHPLEHISYDVAKKAADAATRVAGATVEVVSQKLERVAPAAAAGG